MEKTDQRRKRKETVEKRVCVCIMYITCTKHRLALTAAGAALHTHTRREAVVHSFRKPLK